MKATIVTLLFGSFLVLTANGLLSTTLAVESQARFESSLGIGVVLAAFSMGLILGSRRLAQIVARIGHIRTFAACAGSACLATLLMQMFPFLFVWFGARVWTGFALAGIYVVVESWLAQATPAHRRGRILAIYVLVCQLGLSAGQLLFGWGHGTLLVPFVLAAALYAAALIPVSLTRASPPAMGATQRASLVDVFQRAPLGMVSAVFAGVSTSSWTNLGALYLGAEQVDLGRIGPLMGALYVGGIFFQWPIGALSDRLDRRVVLAVVAACLLIIQLGLVLIPQGVGLLTMSFFLIGAFCFVLYPLALAHTQDLASSEETTAFGAVLLVAYGMGSALSPFVFTPLIAWDVRAFPAALAFVAAGFVLFCLFRMVVRPRLPVHEPVQFEPLFLPQTAPAQRLDPRTEVFQLELPFEGDPPRSRARA